MPGGTIKRLVRDRGFGFIRDDGGQEWFFHRSSVQGSFDELNEGQRVSFDEEPSAKGPRAGNVRSDELIGRTSAGRIGSGRDQTPPLRHRRHACAHGGAGVAR